jgi:hypothetical protein
MLSHCRMGHSIFLGTRFFYSSGWGWEVGLGLGVRVEVRNLGLGRVRS